MFIGNLKLPHNFKRKGVRNEEVIFMGAGGSDVCFYGYNNFLDWL